MGSGVAAVVSVAGAGATGGALDRAAAGGEIVELHWDLREPTTPRELGSSAEKMRSVAAPRGGVLDVEILLPGVTVTGLYDMVTAASSIVYDDTPLAGAVADLTLYDRDVESVEDLLPILRRFEAQWGFTDDACAKVVPFVAEAHERMDAAGGDPLAVDWGTTFATSFAAPELNGVSAGLVVRLPPTTFSTYTVISWDPNAEFEGERVTIGSAAAEPLDSAPDAPRCVPAD